MKKEFSLVLHKKCGGQIALLGNKNKEIKLQCMNCFEVYELNPVVRLKLEPKYYQLYKPKNKPTTQAIHSEWLHLTI